VITVNAHSFTIITAHKEKGKVNMEKTVYIREITSTEYPLLKDFLYHAVFIPPGEKPPPRDIIKDPNVFIYIDGFGNKRGDYGVIAEQDGFIVGAAWTRIIPAYGTIDNETPELATSVLPEYRGRGIGTKLMERLFELLRERGYKRISLAVQQKNAAVRFYKRLGYKTIRENDEEFIMVKQLREFSFTSYSVLSH
jgi:ribosomal protein S18 acetylase RimI-like enzyme